MGAPPPTCPPPPPCPTNPPLPALIAPFTDQRRGTVWVQGSDLRYSASDGATYGGTGTSLGAVPDGQPGSMWVDTDDIHYIDENGIERVLQDAADGTLPDAQVGTAWIEQTKLAGRQLSWVGETGNRRIWWNGF